MTHPINSGLAHQEKVVESIAVLREKVTLLSSSVEKNESADTAQLIQFILAEIHQIEIETNYLFELSNCKHLMMIDQIEYIRKLESELSELKPQK